MDNLSGTPNWIVTDRPKKKKEIHIEKKENEIDEKNVDEFKEALSKCLIENIKSTEEFYEKFKNKHISDLLVYLKTSVSICKNIEMFN